MWSEVKARISAASGKRGCLESAKRGELGNTMPSWTCEEWAEDPKEFLQSALFGVRCSSPKLPYQARWRGILHYAR